MCLAQEPQRSDAGEAQNGGPSVSSQAHYHWGPQGFGGSGENGYLFSGSWGALVIISGDLGSKLIILGF